MCIYKYMPALEAALDLVPMLSKPAIKLTAAFGLLDNRPKTP